MPRPALAVKPTSELLDLLPKRSAVEFSRGSVIYSPLRPSHHLYMVLAGRVKVSSTPQEDETVCRLVFRGGLFGEPGLIHCSVRDDSAVALDAVSVASWSSEEVEKQIDVNPRLGVVLCQQIVQQCLELSDRMRNLVAFKTPERIMNALAQLARTTGHPAPDGFTRIEALTHQTLAEFVGTSREVVTFQLNRLRSLGYIRYSRQFIDVAVGGLEAAIK